MSRHTRRGFKFERKAGENRMPDKGNQLTRYLVISYDDDEQQWFWDYVLATSEEHAKRRILEDIRPYVLATDAIDLHQLQDCTKRLVAIPQADITHYLDEAQGA